MPTILTYYDAISRLTDYQVGKADPVAVRHARRSLHDALDILSQSHHWTYYYNQGRITTSAPQEDGTIAYDHTGHASGERIVTLTDDTWPDWVEDGILRIGVVNYEIAAQVSSTLIQLDLQSNPGEDVASGTSYTLLRDAYVLPPEVWTIDELYPEDIGPECGVEQVHPREWLSRQRFESSAANYPSVFTVMGSDDYLGVRSLRLAPYPDSAFTLDYVYSRRARPLVFEEVVDGTVTNTAGSSTITGTDTAFTEAMIGSILRLAVSSSGEVPTGRDGANPYAYERTITAVASTTSLTVDQSIAVANTNVKYMISDPVDIDVAVMGAALFRCAENELGKLSRLEDRAALDSIWEKALIKAREADSPSTARRGVNSVSRRRRLRDYPAGADEE